MGKQSQQQFHGRQDESDEQHFSWADEVNESVRMDELEAFGATFGFQLVRAQELTSDEEATIREQMAAEHFRDGQTEGEESGAEEFDDEYDEYDEHDDGDDAQYALELEATINVEYQLMHRSQWLDHDYVRRRAVLERLQAREKRSLEVWESRPRPKGPSLPLMHNGKISPLRQVSTPDEAGTEGI